MQLSCRPAPPPCLEKEPLSRFLSEVLAALGTLPAKCVTGYPEMMRPLSQFCLVLWCLKRCQGIACKDNTTNDVRTPQHRSKSMLQGDFWGFGNPWGPLGGSWGPFGPKSVFRTGEHGPLDPLWASLADPKIDRKSLKFIHVCICCQKLLVPKHVHKQGHFLSIVV